jgi:hypothetical protein
MAKVISPYGDYVNQPNATNLDHIPGDYGWPLLGHTFSYIKDPMAWAQERYKKYGPLQRIATTGVRGVLALGPDLAQQVLLDTDRNFSSKMGFIDRVQKFFEGSLIMEDFEHHKHQRRIVQGAFKNDALQHYTREINRIYDRALDEWEADAGKTIPFFYVHQGFIAGCSGGNFCWRDVLQGRSSSLPEPGFPGCSSWPDVHRSMEYSGLRLPHRHEGQEKPAGFLYTNDRPETCWRW